MTAVSTAAGEATNRERIAEPVFIVSSPRSGSTLLFETLSRAPELFTVGDESHRRIEQVGDLFPGARGWTSNRLTQDDARPETVEALAAAFYSSMHDRDGRTATGVARLLEKTPKNSLRVPFFDAAWNDSRFVYLYRDPKPTLASMIQAWVTGRFVTYPMLPGWGKPAWSLLLVPGWRDLIGKPLPEVVARQWATTTNILVDDLARLPADRIVCVDHSDLIRSPQQTMVALTGNLGLNWDLELPATLPLSRMTYSQPSPDKWRKIEGVIESVWHLVEAADAKARAFIQSRG